MHLTLNSAVSVLYDALHLKIESVIFSPIQPYLPHIFHGRFHAILYENARCTLIGNLPYVCKETKRFLKADGLGVMNPLRDFH